MTVRMRSASSSCWGVSVTMRYGLFPSAHISPHQACCRSSFSRRFGNLDPPALSRFSASLGRPIHGTSTAKGASSPATLGVASTCRPCSSCQAAWSLRCVGRINSLVSTRIIFCRLVPARLASLGACALRGAVPWASASRRPCAAARSTGARPALRSRRRSRPLRVGAQHPAEVSHAGCARLLSLPPAFPCPPWTGPVPTPILCACICRRRQIMAGHGAPDMRNRGSHAAPAHRQDGGDPSKSGAKPSRAASVGCPWAARPRALTSMNEGCYTCCSSPARERRALESRSCLPADRQGRMQRRAA